MTYQTGINRISAGRIAFALLASLAIFMVFAFSTARVAYAEGGGEADCPEGTTRIDNYSQSELVVGLDLLTGLTDTEETDGAVITARTESGGEAASVTVLNETDANVTIAVKGGSDQVGNFVTIAPGASATISVTGNPTISNLTVCEGPDLPPGDDDDDDTGDDDDDDDDDDDTGDDDDDTGDDDDDDDDDDGVAGGNPTPRDGTLGGNPVPDTAMTGPSDVIVPTLLTLFVLAGLGGLTALRLARRP